MRTTHAGALMPHPVAGPAPEIGWLNPMTSGGTAAHANTGVDTLLEARDNVDAGIVGYAEGPGGWSRAGWTWGSSDNPPLLFTDVGAGKVRVEWQSFNGNPLAAPSLGTLILTATVNGVAVAAGQRLSALAAAVAESNELTWTPE